MHTTIWTVKRNYPEESSHHLFKQQSHSDAPPLTAKAPRLHILSQGTISKEGNRELKSTNLSETPLLGFSSQPKPPTKPLYSSTQFSRRILSFKKETISSEKGDCQGLNHLKPLLPARFSRISCTIVEVRDTRQTMPMRPTLMLPKHLLSDLSTHTNREQLL